MTPRRWTAGAALAVALLALSARGERVRLTSALPFATSGTRLVSFPEDFSFPFGGVTYKGCQVSADGLITFITPASAITPIPFPPPPPTTVFLTGRPQIAPLWTDLDPGLGGTLAVGRISPAELEFRWSNIPQAQNPTLLNDFSCVLRNDGSFRFRYGTLNLSAAMTALVGFSTGNANTAGAGTAVTFSTSACPGVWGTGSEPAIYEFFQTANGATVLGGLTLCFAPALPGSGRLTLADNDIAEVALSGWTFPFHGNRYTSMWVNSNGNLSFGGRDVDGTPTGPEFLARSARISPFWADLNPGLGGLGRAGTVVVTQTAGSATVAWTNVPFTGQAASVNTFSVTLNADGTFAFAYGAIGPTPPTTSPNALVGQTGGYPVTTGLETPGTLPPSPISTIPGAVFDLPAITAFPYGNQAITWDAGHLGSGSALPLGNNEAVEVRFQNGFRFPFAGTSYGSMFVNADGYLCFGGNDVDNTETSPEFLGLFPRIAAAWDDLNAAPNVTTPGAPEGNITVTGTATSVTINYTVFESPVTGNNQFTVSLNSTGAFQVAYGSMSLQDALVGWAAGGGKAVGGEAPVNLSSAPNWGTGTEAAIYEVFTAAAPLDLAGTILSFAGPGAITFQAPIASPSLVPVALGAGPGDGGLTYVIAASLGSLPGISLGPCGTIGLNVDILLILSLQGLVFFPFTGPLDGEGQLSGWPTAAMSPLVLNVPGGLTGLGVTVWSAFVTYPGPCIVKTIAPSAPITIP